MKIDQIVGLKTSVSQATGKSQGSTHGLSSGFGGAGIAWIVRDDLSGATLFDQASDTSSSGGGDNAATLGYDADPSNPITFSFLPQPGTSGGSDSGFATALVEDYGSGLPKSGSPSVDFFAKPGGGGSGGGAGGGGGTTPSPWSPGVINHINFTAKWDSSVGSAPTGFISGFEKAVTDLLGSLTGPATDIPITLNVGWGETGGTRLSTFALGQSLTYIEQRSYSTFQPLMASMASLPSGDGPIAGAHYWVPAAEEKALGLGVQDTTLTSDGAVGFGSRFSWDFSGSVVSGSSKYDFVAVAKHEITEAMGRISILGGTVGGVANSYTPFDLFRYTAPGEAGRSLTGGADAYFSFDAGNSSNGSATNPTNTYFNSTAGGDWGDWQSSGNHSAGNDAYDAFASAGVSYTTGNVDTLVMSALGYGKIA